MDGISAWIRRTLGSFRPPNWSREEGPGVVFPLAPRCEHGVVPSNSAAPPRCPQPTVPPFVKILAAVCFIEEMTPDELPLADYDRELLSHELAALRMGSGLQGYVASLELLARVGEGDRC